MDASQAYYQIYRKIGPIFRRKRVRMFQEALKPDAETRILDVGGYYFFWADYSISSKITILNTHHVPLPEANPQFEVVQGDGTHLQFPDNSFDIVHSNSVIEHVGTFEQQKAFAQEVRRVGKKLWVQTPARSYPIEPHLLAVGLHWLPRSWQSRLLRRFSLWGWINKPSQQEIEAFLDEVRLLTFSEMRELFPDCQIIKEKTLGVTKSYIAYRV